MQRRTVAVACLLWLLTTAVAGAAEHVVLLHGLGRTARSMRTLERGLTAADYTVLNIDYPSRKHCVEILAAMVRRRIAAGTASAATVHVVTHSLGGIVLRQIQRSCPLENLGRVVMLSPPNQGSELAERLSGWCLYDWIFGPAGGQLGTGPADLPCRLGPVDFELGVITGDRTVNPLFSRIIPGPDDGKVAVARAPVAGMRAFTVVHATHPFIMNDPDVLDLVCRFLSRGSFAPAPQ